MSPTSLIPVLPYKLYVVKNTVPILTVIICTYNRAKLLRSCLQSLAEQTVSTNNFNVLVVNNNSNDNTLEVAKSFHGAICNIEIITELQQGLSYARNAGAKTAQTEWVVYLDDDAKAHNDWIEIILDTIAKNDFDVFGGAYTAWHYYRKRPKWFLPEWESNEGSQKNYGPLSTAIIGGGNCAYRRILILDFNGFPVEKGMSGKKMAYGEETLLIHTMQSTGTRIGFVPAMLIDHLVLPYKYSIIWRLQSIFSRNRDSIIAEKKPFRLYSLLYHLLCASYSVFIRFPIKTIKFLFCKTYFFQNAVIDGLSPAFRHVGLCIRLFKNFN